MPANPTFAIIGGDRRLTCLAQEISRSYPVTCCGTSESLGNFRPISALLNTIQTCDVLVFPMPFSKDGFTLSGTEISIEEIIDRIPAGKIHIFGGKFPNRFKARCTELDIPYTDWMDSELVSLPNAVLTAEGAVLEALQHTPNSLAYTNAAVLGYGRCGKALAVRLKNLCLQTTVFARNPIQRLEAEMAGIQSEPLENLAEKIAQYGLLFNTIPAMVLGKTECSLLSPETNLLDLASGDIAEHVDIKTICSTAANAVLCPGLPGKYFPKAAGHILAQAVLTQMKTST